MAASKAVSYAGKQPFSVALKKNYQKHKSLYWIAIPVVLFYAIFKATPHKEKI